MKIVHWTLKNGSGMNNVAADLAVAERKLGLDSVCLACDKVEEWEGGVGADIHVSHTHIPDSERLKGGKVVWVGHGTPETVFQSSVEAGLNGGHGFGDSWMLVQHHLRTADALVTFWPRQQAIWESMVSKGRKVHCVPFGINKEFWAPTASRGKFAGTPSVLNAENCHYIKWPLDLVLMWPWVVKEVPDARLHMFYLPNDQHRWWFPLMNQNGCSYYSHIARGKLDHAGLQNAFASVDFYFNTVRYGDYNRIGLEAKASGTKLISYAGNPYADFWITDTDQRFQALQLQAILKGEVAPRETLPVPTIEEMAAGMKAVYEETLC